MPVFKRGSVTINYEVRGSGHPLLLLAPGGMRSVASMWAQQTGKPRPPWINPLDELSDRFQVIAMDQRNAGASVAPITSDDGWQVYLEDQLALTSDRVTAAVLQNPIGLTAENRPKFYAMFDEWADEMRSTHPEVDDRVETSFRNRMFGGDFVFSVDRDFVRSSQIPLMVMPGGDDFHPRAVAEEIVALAPDSVLLSPWGGDEHRGQTLLRVAEFLGAHTPN